MEFFKKKFSPRTQKILVACGLAVALIVSFCLGFFVNYFLGGKNDSLDWVTGYIDKYYCVLDENGDPIEFSDADYSKAVTELLDKYSEYYTAEEYQRKLAEGRGDNVGIGITYLIDSTDTVLYGVIGNSPADKAGLRGGDKIEAIEFGENNVQVTDKDGLFAVLESIPVETDFIIHYRRGENRLSATVKKTAYQVSYCTYYDNQKSCKFMADDNQTPQPVVEDSLLMNNLADDTFYIRFESFSGKAVSQFSQCLELGVSRGKTKLVLDMRDNGGGYMNILCEIASFLVEREGEDKPILVYSKDKNSKMTEYRADGNEVYEEITDVCVIANENSASATECLIGAMLYYGTAFSIGNLVLEKNAEGVARTFGKGIMQTTYYNVVGVDAIKLTTAYLFQPDKTTSIHQTGIRTTELNGVEKGQGINRAIEILASK